MRRRRGALAALAAATVATFLGGACFSDRQGNVTGLPDDCQELARAAGIPANNVVIGIKDFVFQPTTAAIARGTVVTWVNCDTAAHTATADDKSWTSPLLQKGQTYTRTFNTGGNVPYHCEPHPTMRAQLIVS